MLCTVMLSKLRMCHSVVASLNRALPRRSPQRSISCPPSQERCSGFRIRASRHSTEAFRQDRHTGRDQIVEMRLRIGFRPEADLAGAHERRVVGFEVQ